MTVTLPPTVLLLLGVLVLSGLIFVALGTRAQKPGPSWPAALGLEKAPPVLIAIGAVIWLGLFVAFLYGTGHTFLDVMGLFDGPSGVFGWLTGGEGRLTLLAFAAMAGGLSALVAFPLSLIRTAQGQHQTRQGERQTRATEQGLITDRINKAVENLGAEKTRKIPLKHPDGTQKVDRKTKVPLAVEETVPNLEVRIGGLYALDRIARENLNFHVQIMQILCAYVRQNAPASGAQPAPALNLPDPPAGADLREVWREWREDYRNRLREAKAARPAPRDDIQIAMELIGRRSQAQRRVEAAWRREGGGEQPDNPFDTPPPDLPEAPANAPDSAGSGEEILKRMMAYRYTWSDTDCYRPDLRNTNLQDLDLSALNLRGCLLSGAEMQGVNLRDAKMQGTNLGYAKMQGADLGYAEMQGADLGYAEMQGADLRYAWMQGADLGHAEMQGADLGYAWMQGADLGHAEMQGAYLEDAKMQGAKLGYAEMQGAGLWVAQMQGANLGDAQMQGADLRGAQMQGAVHTSWIDISKGRLASTDLTRAGLTADQIKVAFGDGTVTLPPDLNLVIGEGDLAHWPKENLSPQAYNRAYRAWIDTLPETSD